MYSIKLNGIEVFKGKDIFSFFYSQGLQFVHEVITQGYQIKRSI